MPTIQLTKRAARLLRDNLTSNQAGYDYTDLCRLDRLAKQLTEVQGEYASRMAELARKERMLRRRLSVSPEDPEASHDLQELIWDAEDLNEAASGEVIAVDVSGEDYKLIVDKLDSVSRWMGVDDLREVIIGMVEAVKAAGAQPNGHEPDRLVPLKGGKHALNRHP